MDNRLINFRIPTQLADELKLIALLKKTTMQEIVISLIERFVKENRQS